MKALDDLEELQTFALVVDLGSLSAAARHLQVTTNAVSRRVMRLEQNLGVKVPAPVHAPCRSRQRAVCSTHTRAGPWRSCSPPKMRSSPDWMD